MSSPKRHVFIAHFFIQLLFTNNAKNYCPFENCLVYLNYKAIGTKLLFLIFFAYLSKKTSIKFRKSSPNLSSTQNGIQSCSLPQLKGNLVHKNNNDTTNITLSNRGVSFQFRLAMKSFFIYIPHGQHVSDMLGTFIRNSSNKTQLGYMLFS